jgi:AmmeMemoRadiSam system protein B/AmmeMemoRadiSam system protein A
METEVKSEEVRRSAWAGQFYPASPTELSRTIAGFYAACEKPEAPADIVAVVAPHAGYEYSGRIAASAYKLLEGHEFEAVVVVSPSHTKYFRGISVYNGGSYETPLGVLPTHAALAKRLSRVAPSTIYLSNMGHTGGGRAEHAVEVQLPFLQIVLGAFKLVSVVMGEQQDWHVLGDALAALASDRPILLVASSDLSHYHPAPKALRLDTAVRDGIKALDPAALSHTFETGKGEACGAGPILACLHAARKMGATRSLITGFGNSGEVSGDDSGVVGYLSAVLVRDEAGPSAKQYILNADLVKQEGLSAGDRQELLRIARQAVASAVYGGSAPEIDKVDKALRQRRGVFVTLKVGGHLRGCLGSVEASTPLVELVVRMAVAAATRDPRFEPMTAAELADLSIELSVLGPLERCEDADAIEVGRHGLLVRKGERSGLLLPQVASENGWDRMAFLRHTCLKAGLPSEAWRDSAANLYIFEAEVF